VLDVYAMSRSAMTSELRAALLVAWLALHEKQT
jgi:hypothetical protein